MTEPSPELPEPQQSPEPRESPENSPFDPNHFFESPLPYRFCLRCKERLPRFGPQKCVRCSLTFDAERPETFLVRRQRNALRFWWPGFLTAVISGTVSYALLLITGEMGVALFFAVPLSAGAILGYGTVVDKALLFLLGLCLIAGIVFALVIGQFSGIFCGLVLAVIFLIPTSLGMFIGYMVRLKMMDRDWDQRWFFPLILFALLPYGAAAIEALLPHRTEIATVRTELTVNATPREAWNAIMFYEDVRHEPPWLLKLALPKPIRSTGNKQRVGETVRCFYDRGHLSKRISRVEPERQLTFEVVEQQLHFERDVALRDGGFELEPVNEKQTRIILTTRYERKLSPRFVWEPIERKVIHTLHSHVLEGMRRAAVENRTNPEQPQEPPKYQPKTRSAQPPNAA